MERMFPMQAHPAISQIRIGTCVPGGVAEKWVPPMIEAGFETLSINFHMEYGEVDIA
jgi:hypothetical protein